MFTGIVEEVGVIQAVEKRGTGFVVCLEKTPLFKESKIGDSVCLNGCCLTIIQCDETVMAFDVVQETIARTDPSLWRVGSRVNLERSMNYQTLLSGHLVQGHVDGIGFILEKKRLPDESWWVIVTTSEAILRYVVAKGSIAVDGVSLTVAELQQDRFAFAMIPHTAQITTLGYKLAGESVNLEIDVIAKYVERLLKPWSTSHE